MAVPVMEIAEKASGLTRTFIADNTRAARAERQALKGDIRALKKDQLGYSEAEKNTALAAQLATLRAANSGTTDALNRQQAAQGGAQSGAYFKAIAQNNAATQGQAGVLGGQIQMASDQKAAQRRADIIARLAAKGAANREMANNNSQSGTITGGGAKSGSNLTAAHDIAK